MKPNDNDMFVGGVGLDAGIVGGMNRPRLLDAFCGAGGCSKGYQMAGFSVTGIDHKPQPRYVGDAFILGDALEVIAKYGHLFDVVHASPPCQEYSSLKRVTGKNYPDLVGVTRNALIATGKTYVIENVVGAPLINPIMLCGTMFGLRIIRHRLFECWPPVDFAPAQCAHTLPVVKVGRRPDSEKNFVAMVGHFSDVEQVRKVVGIDWMTRDELSQAIPPVFTRWIGEHLMQHLFQLEAA